jgi:signal peptidase I
MVVVDILLATVCFTFTPGGTEECHPVLVGGDTPRGEFVMNKRVTESAGYGGDVLQFRDDPDGVYAIHRVYLLNPKEKRAERLRSPDPKQRRITRGCVNVDPAVYDRLMSCCSRNQALLIK